MPINTEAKVNAIMALKAICDVIIDGIATAGKLGTPSGTIYAMLMSAGCSLEQFEQIMGALVAAGKVVKRGHVYFVPEVK
jgi:hypothetical protein